MIFLIRIMDNLFSIYFVLIMARVVISWVPDLQRNRAAEIIYTLTEPVLAPLRKLVPLPGIDISPLLAIIIMRIVRQFLTGMLL